MGRQAEAVKQAAAPEEKVVKVLATARKELTGALEAMEQAERAVKAARLEAVKVLVELAMASELVSLLKPKRRGKLPSVKRGKKRKPFMSGMAGV